MNQTTVRTAVDGASPEAPPSPLTFDYVRESPRVRLFVKMADASLEQIGYTEHGERHVGLVSRIAYNVMKRMGRPERQAELAAIAGLLHDIGNSVNRDHHAQTGAVMAMTLLRRSEEHTSELQSRPHLVCR